MSKHVHTEYDDGCLTLPRFERVKYFYGQLLGVREFQAEQSYFLEKHRLHNRYLHGYGVVCGLAVELCRAPRDPCDDPKPKHPRDDRPHDPDQHSETGKELVAQHKPGSPPQLPEKLCVEIDCGLALDCQGNEIVVPWPRQIDLVELLGCDTRKYLLEGKHVYLSLCFKERPLEPVRPLSADSCGGLLPDCVPSRLRDDYCVRASWECAPHDETCSPCERPCDDPCLALAVIYWKADYGLVIDNRIRRTLAPYVTTKVAGLSWLHGATYRPKHVDAMFKRGLRITFTDEVRTASLQRGVIDVWVVQSGEGRSGDLYNLPIEIEPSDPHKMYSRSVTVVVPGKAADRIDPRDRVLVQLRSAFVLDRCCRPIDGEHVGGLVPQLEDCKQDYPPVEIPIHVHCQPPEPRPYGPWTSGNGSPGGNFESWFYVGEDRDEK